VQAGAAVYCVSQHLKRGNDEWVGGFVDWVGSEAEGVALAQQNTGMRALQQSQVAASGLCKALKL